jgi:RNA polymerase sigma factor (TIGR02999 family)
MTGRTDQPIDRGSAAESVGTERPAQDLLPLVYDELRRQARQYLRKEHRHHSLQATALVHEAYLRLSKQRPKQFANRQHFLAIAAQLMRQVLVEHARRHRTAKRGGNAVVVVLDNAIAQAAARNVSVLALDEALTALEKLDARQARIVELRFLAGLSIEETSAVLGMSAATVKRDWTTARAWLQREMSR